MEFETYILNCVRTRPEGQDWQFDLVHAVLGLVSSTTRLASRLREPSGSIESLERDVRGLLERVEHFRALLYYRLDLRPLAGRTQEHQFGSAQRAAAALPTHAGILAGHVDAWLFDRAGFDDAIVDALRDLDRARNTLHSLLGIDEQALWSADPSRDMIRLQPRQRPTRRRTPVAAPAVALPSTVH